MTQRKLVIFWFAAAKGDVVVDIRLLVKNIVDFIAKSVRETNRQRPLADGFPGGEIRVGRGRCGGSL